MPIEFLSRWDLPKAHDHNHSKRRDLSERGIKVPNDFRRGRRKGRR